MTLKLSESFIEAKRASIFYAPSKHLDAVVELIKENITEYDARKFGNAVRTVDEAKELCANMLKEVLQQEFDESLRQFDRQARHLSPEDYGKELKEVSRLLVRSRIPMKKSWLDKIPVDSLKDRAFTAPIKDINAPLWYVSRTNQNITEVRIKSIDMQVFNPKGIFASMCDAATGAYLRANPGGQTDIWLSNFEREDDGCLINSNETSHYRDVYIFDNKEAAEAKLDVVLNRSPRL